MLSVELKIYWSDWGVKEGKLGINSEFDEWNGCSFNEFDLGDPHLSNKQLL